MGMWQCSGLWDVPKGTGPGDIYISWLNVVRIPGGTGPLLWTRRWEPHVWKPTQSCATDIWASQRKRSYSFWICFLLSTASSSCHWEKNLTCPQRVFSGGGGSVCLSVYVHVSICVRACVVASLIPKPHFILFSQFSFSPSLNLDR